MTFIKFATSLFKSLVWAGLIFIVMKALCEVYIDSLKSSGGIVLAKDIVGYTWCPYIIAVISLIGIMKLYLDDK